MAIISSAIVNEGKIEVTKLLIGSGTSYLGIGVGNDTTPASESDTGLLGTEVNFKDGNVSYFTNANNSYISSWNSSWIYDDLATNEFSEIVVTQNASNLSGNILLRGVYDNVVLGSGDSLKITAQVSVDQG